MKKTSMIAAMIILAVCIVTLSSCFLLMQPAPEPQPTPAPEPRYEVAGTWRRTAGEFNSTITYYLKADGTYSYSNNQNGDLDSGEYTVDWANHIISTNHQMNHSLDKKLPFSFSGPNTLTIDGYTYSRVK